MDKPTREEPVKEERKRGRMGWGCLHDAIWKNEHKEKEKEVKVPLRALQRGKPSTQTDKRPTPKPNPPDKPQSSTPTYRPPSALLKLPIH